MQRFTYGTCPADVIRIAVNTQCPNGYPMTIKSQREWKWISDAVNQGIDSHLEALTQRSTFNVSTGECNVHPDELHVLLRRLGEMECEEEDEENGDSPHDLRSCILSTLDIEEV